MLVSTAISNKERMHFKANGSQLRAADRESEIVINISKERFPSRRA